MEIHHRRFGRHQPGAARDRPVLLERDIRSGADLRHDLGRAARIAPRLNPALVSLSFLLVLIGYGAKVGLAPMHTWLPDAHSEGPAPVSALLSGALLNTAMVGIVRYLAVADAAGISTLARGTLLALGAFSLFVAALFIVRQTGRQAADGLFQRRAHGRHRARLRLRRIHSASPARSITC